MATDSEKVSGQCDLHKEMWVGRRQVKQKERQEDSLEYILGMTAI